MTKLLPHLFEIGTESLMEVMPNVLSGKTSMEENVLEQDEDLVMNANMIHLGEGALLIWRELARVYHNKVRGLVCGLGSFCILPLEMMTVMIWNMSKRKLLIPSVATHSIIVSIYCK